VTVDPGRTPEDEAAADNADEVPGDGSHVALGAPKPEAGDNADADLALLDSIEEELDEVERALGRLDDDER
jgi:hypothetical protein